MKKTPSLKVFFGEVVLKWTLPRSNR